MQHVLHLYGFSPIFCVDDDHDECNHNDDDEDKKWWKWTFFFILHVSLCRLGKHFMADSPPIRTSMSVCVFLHVTFLMKPFATVLEWANKRTISTVNNWNSLHKSNRSVETSIFICTTCVSSCVCPASMPVWIAFHIANTEKSEKTKLNCGR